eukprot:IDg1868t1
MVNSTTRQGLTMTMLIDISRTSLPRLVTDPYMLRPKIESWSVGALEQNIMLVAIGYNFGFTSSTIANGTAIVSEKSKVVPTVQLGYFVCISVMILVCIVLIVYNQVALLRRKIIGLAGEKRLIHWWQRQHGLPAQNSIDIHLVKEGTEYTL